MGFFGALGNAFGGNERRAKVWLELDHHNGSYYGGEELGGTVYLDVVKEGFKANTLCLSLTGEEHTVTHWTTSSGSGKNKKTTHHYKHQRRNVVKIPVMLDEFDYKEPMRKGMRRQYKFSFKLPDVLPPTINRIRGGGGSAELKYSVAASCTTPGTMWSGEVNFSKMVHVAGGPGNPAPPTQLVANMEPVVVPVTVCCCCDIGQMAVGARADKTVLAPMDSITVRSVVKNNSTAVITSVNTSIEQRGRWSYAGHHNSSCMTAAENQDNPMEVEGTKAMTKEDVAKEKAKAKKGGSGNDPLHIDLAQQLDRGEGSSCTIHLSPNTAISYYGQLFSIQHHLSVTSMTGCCVTNPTVSTAVVVCARPGDRTGSGMQKDEDPPPAYEMPPDWASTMESKNVNVPMAQAYYGGSASQSTDDGEPAMPCVAVAIDARTYQTLLQEMTDSVFDEDIVKRYIKESSFMSSLNAPQLAECVRRVDNFFGRSDVAMLFMNALTRPIVSADCIAVMPHIETASQKSSFVQAMLPKITDLDSGNKARIKGSLSAFEVLLVGSALD